MIVFDGEKWTIPKYKITRAVVVYDDRPELYPDGVAEEVTLNADQISRLEEIRYNTDMSMDQVEAYVIRGEGTPPDNRTDIDKLIDLIPEPTEEVMKIVDEWKPDARYQKGHYLKHNGTLYKVLQVHVSQSDWTPDKSPSLFAPLHYKPQQGKVLEWKFSRILQTLT